MSKILLNEVHLLIEKFSGAAVEEDMMIKMGWYPVDKRMMAWAHSEISDDEPVRRGDVLQMIYDRKYEDLFPGVS